MERRKERQEEGMHQILNYKLSFSERKITLAYQQTYAGLTYYRHAKRKKEKSRIIIPEVFSIDIKYFSSYQSLIVSAVIGV